MTSKKKKKNTQNNDRYGWIGKGGIPELQKIINNEETEIELIVEPKIKISCKRYEELIEAEANLKSICRVLKKKGVYDLDTYQAIAGKKYFPDKD